MVGGDQTVDSYFQPRRRPGGSSEPRGQGGRVVDGPNPIISTQALFWKRREVVERWVMEWVVVAMAAAISSSVPSGSSVVAARWIPRLVAISHRRMAW